MASRDMPRGLEESPRTQLASGAERAPTASQGASASELAAMLDGVGVGVVGVDREWRVSFLNAWMERVLGRSRGEVLGKDLWAEFPVLAATSFADVYRRAMREGVELVHEDFVAPASGRYEARASPSSTGLLIFIRDVTERWRAAQDLKDREDRLRLILAAGGLGYWRLELVTGRLESSDGCKANFGLTPEEELSSYEALRALIHPEDRAAMAAAVERALHPAGDGDYAAEYRVLPPGGGTRWVAARGRRVLAADGTAWGLAGITQDVTARRLAEEALRESEARFRNMADNAPVMLWMTDATGSCIWLNLQWHDFTGQIEEEGRGLGWLSAVHPEDRAMASDAFLSSNANQEPFRAEYRIRSKDGEYRWAIDSATPRFGPSGEFLGYIGSVTDIHERKRGEERLAFVSEASRLLSESLDYETTLSRAAKLAVPALCDWCMVDVVQDGGGFKRVEVACADPALEPLARNAMRFPPSPHANPLHPPTQALRELRSVLVEETDEAWKVRTALGPEHLAQMRAVAFRSLMSVPLVARGRTLGVLTFLAIAPGRRFSRADLETAEDMARRAALAVDNGRLYREAQQAVRVREEFLQVASHELKTPLTPLSLKLQVLTRAAESHPREQWPRLTEDLATMRQQVRRLSQLMDELLDVSRISSGRFSLHVEPVDLGALVRETAARFEPEVLRLGGRLEVEAPERVEGQWDRQRLEQVVTNLLSNALKYGDGKPVQVRVAKVGTSARLVVRDEGIGIARDALRRIFGKFERAVSERHYGGLGLGLYITRQIVDALGGTIQVESEQGQGATFIVELPLSPPAAES
ncbi:MAG TPA: PAS domain S-box protein [Myxococcus sp.]|nr:PAS domain S-box protein [Myxococcus sp.]